jgi:hypothetical protein
MLYHITEVLLLALLIQLAGYISSVLLNLNCRVLSPNIACVKSHTQIILLWRKNNVHNNF